MWLTIQANEHEKYNNKNKRKKKCLNLKQR